MPVTGDVISSFVRSPAGCCTRCLDLPKQEIQKLERGFHVPNQIQEATISTDKGKKLVLNRKHLQTIPISQSLLIQYHLRRYRNANRLRMETPMVMAKRSAHVVIGAKINQIQELTDITRQLQVTFTLTNTLSHIRGDRLINIQRQSSANLYNIFTPLCICIYFPK
ncbi:PREDICTED: uncharacterized protein LOC106297197 isoform X2 [Brassica oleracea var. oleracea]|uniref:uncharacterized protein LOC106297197 isoform X2 n=1 Tax=Brassica oleracea var. oleracea TaxID=109376 RepID=UPI0006A73002|nr:PREDICTED: uncharacterized protein LOC106297197 isoform X2 [Brassica oleracea var. oleracea]